MVTLIGIAIFMISCEKNQLNPVDTTVEVPSTENATNVNNPTKGGNFINSLTEADVVNMMIQWYGFVSLDLHQDVSNNGSLSTLITSNGYTLNNCNLLDATIIQMEPTKLLISVPYSADENLQFYIWGTFNDEQNWNLDFVILVSNIKAYNVDSDFLADIQLNHEPIEGEYASCVVAYDNVYLKPGYTGRSPSHPSGQSWSDCVVADAQDFMSDGAGVMAGFFFGPIVGTCIAAHCAWHTW